MDTQATEQSSGIRLHYFNGLNARAALIRAIFYSQNIQFEEVKYNFEKWAGVKKSGDFEFEQMPMLEIHRKKLTQSFAICLYLSRLYDLLGSSAYEEYLITSLMCSNDDITPKLLAIFFPKTEEQKAALATNTNDFLTIHAPFILKRWEARYNANGTDYMIGNSFTLADIFITVNIYLLFKNPLRSVTWEPVLNENAPNLSKLAARIAENELSSYFKIGYVAESTF